MYFQKPDLEIKKKKIQCIFEEADFSKRKMEKLPNNSVERNTILKNKRQKIKELPNKT